MTEPRPTRATRRARVAPVGYFVAESETIARTIVSLGLRWEDGTAVTHEKIAAVRPKHQRDVYEWITFYRRLHRCHAQVQYGGAMPSTSGESGSADLQGALTLANEPRIVPLIATHDDGRPRQISVYPKSFTALMHISTRDERLGFLAREISRLGVVQTPDALDAFNRGLAELDYQQRVMVWCVTTPGCKLPFDHREDPRPEIPAGLKLDELYAVDVVNILRGHLEVNLRGVQALKVLLGEPSGDKPLARASWTVFFSNLGEALHMRPETLMDDWALAEVLTMVRSVNAERQKQLDAAKKPHAA